MFFLVWKPVSLCCQKNFTSLVFAFLCATVSPFSGPVSASSKCIDAGVELAVSKEIESSGLEHKAPEAPIELAFFSDFSSKSSKYVTERFQIILEKIGYPESRAAQYAESLSRRSWVLAQARKFEVGVKHVHQSTQEVTRKIYSKMLDTLKKEGIPKPLVKALAFHWLICINPLFSLSGVGLYFSGLISPATYLSVPFGVIEAVTVDIGVFFGFRAYRWAQRQGEIARQTLTTPMPSNHVTRSMDSLVQSPSRFLEFVQSHLKNPTMRKTMLVFMMLPIFHAAQLESEDSKIRNPNLLSSNTIRRVDYAIENFDQDEAFWR